MALVALAGLFALAFLLAGTRPPSPPAGPGAARMLGVELRLYPAADPEADWLFTAREVSYDPARKTSRIRGRVTGERRVGGELDLRLSAEEVELDRNDNLRMRRAVVEIPRECWRIELEGEGGTPVVIDQRRGFSAPRFTLTGPGVRVEGREFRSDFGLKEASWRSGREEWLSEEEVGCEN